MSIETPPPRRGVAPSQEGGIKVIPKPEDVAVEAPPIEAPIVTPPGVNRRRFLAGLGGLAAGAAIEAHPATRAIVNPLMERLLAALGLRERPVPDFFNNNDQSGVIGDKNTIALPLSEIQKEFPQQLIEQDNTLTMLFPFRPPKGASVRYERGLSEMLPSQELKQEAQKNGIKDYETFILPKDTVIVVPADSHVLVARGDQEARENPNMSPWTRVFSYDQKKNITYIITFGARDTGSTKNHFQTLVEMSDYTPSTWVGQNWENLPRVQQGEEILRTTIENQPVSFTIRAYKGRIVGPPAEVVNKQALSLLTPRFFTKTEEGQSKLVVL